MDTNKIKKMLYENLKNHSSSMTRYIYSDVNTIACFCAMPVDYNSIIAVTDSDYNPICYFELQAYTHICGISNDGNFAIFRTANSPYEDGNKAILVDVRNKSIIWKLQLETSFKSITDFFIDTNMHIIHEYHNEYTAMYSFSGVFMNRNEYIENRYKHNDCSSYELLDIAVEIIENVQNTKPNKKDLRMAIKYIDIAKADSNMSTYKLSLAYKKLGDLYCSLSDTNNALKFYNKGLLLNPKLPVKKNIKKLEKLEL